MEEPLEIKQKIKLLPSELKARATASHELFKVLKEAVAESPGLKARIIGNPFTVYRGADCDERGWRYWTGKLINIGVDDEGELKITYDPEETGKVGSEIELFEIMVAFEEQEKRFLEWLSQILSVLPDKNVDLTAEFIKKIDTKLQDKPEEVHCYRYEDEAYPRTYIKFRQLGKPEEATPYFSMDIHDYDTNKLLNHIYFDSKTEMVEAIKYLIEGFQYLERETIIDESPLEEDEY